ncbi:hypothetical protein SDC9_87145 [bioreactor metagenome]|uniref:Uncharacterized protein n=1 Tax=bioreactor metagenome TaxID=1076179 RepID=A0A644ZKV1_9ZZZZ
MGMNRSSRPRQSKRPNMRVRSFSAPVFTSASAMDTNSSEPSSSSREMPKSRESCFSESRLGYPLPVSHLETVTRETNTFSASCSCVRPEASRADLSFSLNCIFPIPFPNILHFTALTKVLFAPSGTIILCFFLLSPNLAVYWSKYKG